MALRESLFHILTIALSASQLRCAMAISTCSEGSSTLPAGSAASASDTEQHRDVQQMQQCSPTMSSSIVLTRYHMYAVTVLAVKKLCPATLQHAGSRPPLKQLASRVGCPHDALQKAQGLHVSQSSLPLPRGHNTLQRCFSLPCRNAGQSCAGFLRTAMSPTLTSPLAR